jgi:dTDP-4-dehydrorhamnose reductase
MVVVIGGTGILGREFQKIRSDFIYLNSDFDIFDFSDLEKKLDEINPKIIINCAAIKSEEVDRKKVDSINVNIIGSANLSKYCIKNDIRLVYISTDYVYPGKTGNYNEEDLVYPFNNYAWTKLGGETSVRLVTNHLIVRTSFGISDFPHVTAYDNLYTSKDYVDLIAPMILDVTESELVGLINIGTNRKSIFEYASVRNIITSSKMDTTRDFSLDVSKYKKFKIDNKSKNILKQI